MPALLPVVAISFYNYTQANHATFMKFYLALLTIVLFLSPSVQAQKTEIFYDYNWKECEPQYARYYALIEKKDSLWQRNDYFIRESKLQMTGTYKDKESKIAHGYFRYFHANGNMESAGKFENGKKKAPGFFITTMV